MKSSITKIRQTLIISYTFIVISFKYNKYKKENNEKIKQSHILDKNCIDTFLRNKSIGMSIIICTCLPGPINFTNAWKKIGPALVKSLESLYFYMIQPSYLIINIKLLFMAICIVLLCLKCFILTFSLDFLISVF